MKILHMASFEGNVGDNAAHAGVYKLLTEFGGDYHITQFGLRPFLPEYMEITDEVLDLINEHDVLLIGNGGWWRLTDENSPTGTMFGFTKHSIDRIKRPIVFYGLALERVIDTKPECLAKFKGFLSNIQHTHLSVRNDGTREAMWSLGIAKSLIPREVPDGALLLPAVGTRADYIAVNITLDWVDSMTPIIDKLAHTLDTMLLGFPDLRIVFVPHRYTDLYDIAVVVEKMQHRNYSRMIFTGLSPDHSGLESVMTAYNCRMAIGMRWHSVLIPFSQGTPTVTICTRGKSSKFCEEIGLIDRAFAADGSLDGFTEKVIEVYENPTLPDWETHMKRYHDTAKEFLKGVFGSHS